MACCEPDTSVLTWSEDLGICRTTTTTCTDGVTTTTTDDSAASALACCSEGLATDDAALLEACVETDQTIIEWD